MNAARPIAGKVCMQKKLRAFVEFACRYSIEELLDCLERNEQAGIVYHREGIMGDYDDFDDLEKLIHRQKSRCYRLQASVFILLIFHTINNNAEGD